MNIYMNNINTGDIKCMPQHWLNYLSKQNKLTILADVMRQYRLLYIENGFFFS